MVLEGALGVMGGVGAGVLNGGAWVLGSEGFQE